MWRGGGGGGGCGGEIGGVVSWLEHATPNRAIWGSSPGWEHCIVFLGKTLNYTHLVPPSTQVYKWVLVLVNLMLGVITLRWTNISSRG